MSSIEQNSPALLADSINEIKKAQTDVEILDLIKNRWSPRSLSSQSLSKESIKTILESARWAASSMNEQPWRFIVGVSPDETWSKIGSTLQEFNAPWASKAPLLMIAVGKQNHEAHNEPNPSFTYDVGQSVAFMALQAISMGIYCHQMGGFDRKKAIELFNIPISDYTPLVAIAFGYRNEDINSLHEKYQKSEQTPRSRKPLNELVFSNSWGEGLKI